MRISLLRKREAFAEIIAGTLSRFWSQRFATHFAITWSQSRISKAHAGQTWLCNDYLNCLFLPETTAVCFEPIRREFSRSVQRWRTPFQQAYVTAATSALTSRWLAHAQLRVDPPVPTQTEQLIVPGNTKVRLMSASAQTTWVVLKIGFAREDFLAEIECRTRAVQAGVPVPEIEQVEKEHAFLRERYIIGTPTNRLSNLADQRRAVQAGYAAVLPLIESTLEQKTSVEYADDIERRMHAALAQLHNVTSQTVDRLRAASEELLVGTGMGSNELACSLTHGDFQPGNVLVNGDDLWIIDWEYAGRRMAIYDPLVMGLASRFSNGLADRIADFVEHGPSTETGFWPAHWPVHVGEDRDARKQAVAFFLGEELLLHVKENAKPPITTPGPGLFEMLRQTERILTISILSPE